MTFSSIKTIIVEREYEYITQVDRYFFRHLDSWDNFKAIFKLLTTGQLLKKKWETVKLHTTLLEVKSTAGFPER